MNAIEISDNGKISVSGELDFATVPELDRRGCIFIKKNQNPVFDLNKVTASDNAGVALLISWSRCAKNIGKKVSFINLPKQLLALIAASGLEKVLSIE
jgi:phospholipid transport system transporter-binding protein